MYLLYRRSPLGRHCSASRPTRFLSKCYTSRVCVLYFSQPNCCIIDCPLFRGTSVTFPKHPSRFVSHRSVTFCIGGGVGGTVAACGRWNSRELSRSIIEEHGLQCCSLPKCSFCPWEGGGGGGGGVPYVYQALGGANASCWANKARCLLPSRFICHTLAHDIASLCIDSQSELQYHEQGLLDASLQRFSQPLRVRAAASQFQQ